MPSERISQKSPLPPFAMGGWGGFLRLVSQSIWLRYDFRAAKLIQFLKFVLSYEGQEVVVKDGYLPLTSELAKKELAKLD